MISWLGLVVLCSWKQGRRCRWEKWSSLPLTLWVMSVDDFDALDGERLHKILGGIHTALGFTGFHSEKEDKASSTGLEGLQKLLPHSKICLKP